MVQLAKDGDAYVILRAGSAQIASWGNDPDLRRIHTAEAIRECLHSYGTDTRLAVCGLRGSGVVVRDFEFPALPAEEIKAAVMLEASQICPFGLEDSSLDYQVTSSGEKTTSGFWVAATNVLMRTTRRLIHDAGLRCTLLDVDGLAMLNCLEGSSRTEAPVPEEAANHPPAAGKPALLDVGDLWTTVSIAGANGRPFVRDIALGAEEILRRLSDEMGVPQEPLLAALGGAPEDLDPHALEHSFERACLDLIDDVVATLRYYGAQKGAAKVETMLVSGPLATTERFIELLGARLAVDVQPWNPLAAMPCEADEQCEAVVQKEGASMAVATGLAMRSI